jgi:hypothetical protein
MLETTNRGMKMRDIRETTKREMKLIDTLETTNRDVKTTDRGTRRSIQDAENNEERREDKQKEV